MERAAIWASIWSDWRRRREKLEIRLRGSFATLCTRNYNICERARRKYTQPEENKHKNPRGRLWPHKLSGLEQWLGGCATTVYHHVHNTYSLWWPNIIRTRGIFKRFRLFCLLFLWNWLNPLRRNTMNGISTKSSLHIRFRFSRQKTSKWLESSLSGVMAVKLMLMQESYIAPMKAKRG